MKIKQTVLFVCIAVGILPGVAAEASSIVCPPYYMVHHEGSTNKGELRISANYTLWLPPDVKTLRGIIVHQHGCGPGDDREDRAAAGDLHWQALARKHGCALLVPTYERNDGDHCRWWFDPRNGSDKKFIQALAELAAQSHHPELERIPWALWGHSGGACWAGSMLFLYPNRIAAVWLRSGIPLQMAEPAPDAALAVPVMCNLGIREGVIAKTNRFAFMWGKVREFFQVFRGQGGLIGVAVDPNSEHDCGNSRYLAIPWFDVCLTARLPESAGNPELRPMPTDGAWLALLLGQSAQPASKFTGDSRTAIWLPNERIAKAWSEYVKDGNVSDPTPPPPPRNVRVSATGELTWEAAADLQSGVEGFVIERNGKKLAHIPEQHSGYFVGRPTFQQIGYGDQPKWPLPEMRYTDAKATRGRKYDYAVRTVNTAGLESILSPAVELAAPTGVAPREAFPSEIVSKQWPKGPESTNLPLAIKLDTKLLDACVGEYKIAPCAELPDGEKLTIWREGDQLFTKLSVNTHSTGALPSYPASETNFVLTGSVWSELFLIKNEKGEVTALTRRFSGGGGIEDCLARRVTHPAK